MSKVVLLDTGPLVAFLSARDRHHAWAVRQLATLAPPLLTCEAVVSEACFLLRRDAAGPAGVLELVSQGLIRIGLRLEDEAAAIRRLLESYSDLGTSLADVCLVRLAELHRRCRVLTTDSDFLTYRRHRRGTIPVVMPEQTI